MGSPVSVPEAVDEFASDFSLADRSLAALASVSASGDSFHGLAGYRRSTGAELRKDRRGCREVNSKVELRPVTGAGF
jgi:hypothetical protein